MVQRPRLVMVTGEPGSGKTTLGLALSAALRIPFFSRDLVRGGMLATAGMWRGELRNPPARESAIEAHVQIIQRAAGLGVSCVTEFVVAPGREDALRRLETAADVVVIVVECAAGRARADDRDRSAPLFNRPAVLAALGYDSIDDYLTEPERARIRDEMRTDFGLPTLHVRTDDGYAPALETIVDWVVAQ